MEKENKLLVPFDFTLPADNALQMASILAMKGNMKIVLLHVEGNKSNGEASSRLREISGRISAEHQVECSFKVRQGNILSEIAKEAGAEDSYRFVIIGTHGFKGVREKFFGLDMLHLVKNLTVPVIVLQEHTKIPEGGIRRIVFPAGAHRTFARNIEATIYFSKIFGAEVLLYSIEKSEQDWSEALKNNIELAMQSFEAQQVPYKHITEGQVVFSTGYAKQIVKYAREAEAHLIAVMALPSQEHFYIADSDKERLLTNEAGIPVLFTNS